MIKLIGLLILVAAAGFGGILKAEELKERIRLLEDYLRMMLELKGKIHYFRQPLLQMFRQTADKGHSPAYLLLGRCQACLEETHGEIAPVWSENTRKIYRKTPLTPEDLEILTHPGTFLGQTDYENQQAQFAYVEQRLAEQIAEARGLYEKKGPMYRRIGFFGGAIVALVLL